jgi:hypothetical protein
MEQCDHCLGFFDADELIMIDDDPPGIESNGRPEVCVCEDCYTADEGSKYDYEDL